MSQPRAPRVSVVMAVHNGERYVAEAIRSILAQGYGDLELLVVDDGSTDGSAAIVQAIGDARVRLISNGSNLGLARSLNRGVSEARGELVARLDADDVAEPERLARQVAFMDARPDVALVGSWYVELGADGGSTLHDLPVHHWDLRWHLHLYCPFVHSAVMWRRALVAERVGTYDERLAYSMDFDLWRRIASTLCVANLPEYLVRVRSHADSMTATFGERAREGVRLRAEHAARLLGWPAIGQAEQALRLDRLYRLLVSTPREPLGAQWLRDARELLRLHDAFISTDGAPSKVAARQRHEIMTGLVRRAGRALLPGRARTSAPS